VGGDVIRGGKRKGRPTRAPVRELVAAVEEKKEGRAHLLSGQSSQLLTRMVAVKFYFSRSVLKEFGTRMRQGGMGGRERDEEKERGDARAPTTLL